MAFVWTKVSYSTQDVKEKGASDAAGLSEAKPLESGKKRTVLGLFALIVFMYGGLEGSLNNFMSSFFMNYLDAIAYHASISIGVFWAAMVVGRAATCMIIRKVTYSRYLMTSIIGTIVALVLFIVLKNMLAGYFFVAMLGLTMSGIYSITLVYANDSIPNSAHLVTPIIAGLSGLGAAVFPALTGLAMDYAGILSTLWYIVGIAFSYLVLLLVINQIRDGNFSSFLHLRHHRLKFAFATRRSRFK
jgi:FHS family glucose/mannose:H+ symporter-like MFS transporter